jgi:hypothetical protein
MWKRRTVSATVIFALIGAVIAYYLTLPKPLFAQVVFGPDARLCLWFILDGDTVYLDRAAGDTPRRAERVDDGSIELADPDGRTRYIITKASPFYTQSAVRSGQQQELALHVTITGPVSYQQYGTVRAADRPEMAGIGHVHGPLTVAAAPHTELPPLRFLAGGKPTDVRAIVTTQQANGGSWIAVRSENEERNGPAFPPGIVPLVVIEFPSRAAGEQPVRRQFTLHELC